LRAISRLIVEGARPSSGDRAHTLAAGEQVGERDPFGF